jgi:5'-methylthioadenosine phosphorylase
MSARLACLAGATVYRMLDSGRLTARQLPPVKTPFGPSREVFLVEGSPPFYVMPRHGPGRRRPAPSQINHRANLYALKDLGVQCVLGWSAAGAVTHDLLVGEIIIPSDVIDLTRHRAATFFEKSCLGFLRQFPVFCPDLQQALEEVCSAMDLPCRAGATAAATEGPRLETPAEVRMLWILGAQLVTHTLVPEVFLAKELQLCFAGACYLVSYAETGSRHRPFSTRDLFGGLTKASQDERLRQATGALPEILQRLARRLEESPKTCQCDQALVASADEFDLPPDWHDWFEAE